MDTEFPPTSSRKSGKSFGCCMRDEGYNNSPMTFKTMEVYSNFSKVFNRRCLITGFVCDYDALVYIDKSHGLGSK